MITNFIDFFFVVCLVWINLIQQVLQYNIDHYHIITIHRLMSYAVEDFPSELYKVQLD